MRDLIDRFVVDHDVYLVTADMGSFPLARKTCPQKCIDVGLDEVTAANVALGLAMSGKRVLLYSVAGFLIHRAHEILREASIHSLPITVLNGGAGFLYHNCGLGHYLLDDIALMSSLPNVTLYFPYEPQNYNSFLTTDNIGFHYVRLAPDDAQPYGIHSQQYYPYGCIVIYTLGWLVPIIDSICTRLNQPDDIVRASIHPCTKVVIKDGEPVIDIGRSLSSTNTLLVIEDHVYLGGLHSLLSSAYINSKFNSYAAPCIDYSGRSLEQVRSAYGMTEKRIESFIKNLKKVY